MSWDYKVDEDGRLEIIVSRWENAPPPDGKGGLVVRTWVEGFEPNEPVQVEVYGADE